MWHPKSRTGKRDAKAHGINDGLRGIESTRDQKSPHKTPNLRDRFTITAQSFNFKC